MLHNDITSTQLSQVSTPATKRIRSKIEIEWNRELAIKRRDLVNTLRPMQKDALDFIRTCENASFVIMPTGSGKTAVIPIYKVENKCSIVFAPYKLLVEQLVATLKNSVAYPFECTFDILTTIDFIVMPFEAASEFSTADVFSVLHALDRLGPVWIDEVRWRYLRLSI